MNTNLDVCKPTIDADILHWIDQHPDFFDTDEGMRYLESMEDIHGPEPSTEVDQFWSGNSMNDLAKMLYASMQKHTDQRGQNRPQCNNEELISQLREYADILLTKHEFKVGDIVQAKRGLNTRYKNFDHGTPFIVIALLEGSTYKFQDSGSTYDNEPNDLELSWIGRDGDFFRHAVDSRWFEPWSEE